MARLGARLDSETEAALEMYRANTGLTRSQAERMLVASALAQLSSGVPLDEAFQRTAFKEGLVEGQRKFKEYIERNIAKILEEISEPTGQVITQPQE